MRRILLGLLLLGTLEAVAFARAGGGESYSGGSFSSGSSSYSYGGSSSDSGDLLFSFLYLYIRLVVAKPWFGVPFTIFLVYMLWKINEETFSARHAVAGRGGRARSYGRSSDKKSAELSRLRARDPAFSEEEFLRRAGSAFLKIQQAWSEGSMAQSRAFISDGVRERFDRQLGAMKARGLRNLMENVEVLDLRLLSCASDAHFDELNVLVAASASDRIVDASGATVSGSAGRQEFEEVWTFLRRPGAKTLKSPGLIEGNCPSCGAPLSISDTARCEACRSWVNSGEHDWVLSEITQSCEWLPRDPSRDIGGWAEASAFDPGLSLAAVEDRVSVIFWRWLEARRLGDPGPLRAVADPEVCSAVAGGGSWAAAFENAAVGAVETMAFELDGEWRRVHVGVKWSAGGELRRHFFVLRRAAGAKTDVRQGLRTSRCPSCGAPASDGFEADCSYCSSPLCDAKKDWVLTEVVPLGEWKRPAGRPSIAGLGWGGGMAPADAYAVLAHAMLADGEETLAEKAFLEAYAANRGLPPALAARISAAARGGRLDVPKAEDRGQAETLLRGMIRMSLADGIVTEGERSALTAFAARHGLRPEDVAAMIDRQRQEGARVS